MIYRAERAKDVCFEKTSNLENKGRKALFNLHSIYVSADIIYSETEVVFRVPVLSKMSQNISNVNFLTKKKSYTP